MDGAIFAQTAVEGEEHEYPAAEKEEKGWKSELRKRRKWSEAVMREELAAQVFNAWKLPDTE